MIRSLQLDKTMIYNIFIFMVVHLWVYKTGFEDVTKAKHYLQTNEVL